MKAFTQVLPQLLVKLEVIRQVLETHGLEAKEELRCDPTSINWKLLRGTYSLGIHVYLHEAGRVVLTIRRFGEEHSLHPALAIIYREEKWGLIRNRWGLKLTQQEVRADGWDGNDLECEWAWVQPLAALFQSLPGHNLDDGYSESVARESMGMIAAFFAKLPVDAPTAATTP